MREAFLHYVWKYQLFEHTDLLTTHGETLQIIKPGHHNSNAGPDFIEASLVINTIEWRGQVEIHIQSSDWYHHRHENDPNYQNAILHVVWKHDKEVVLQDGSSLPTIELYDKVDSRLLDRYERLVNFPAATIPCERQFEQVDDIHKLSMIDKLAVQRLKAKGEVVLSLIDATNGDWEEVAYQMLAKNFGLKVNADAFNTLSKHLPYRIIRKYAGRLLSIEALLFGMAGFLSDAKGEYQEKLRSEFEYLRQKHELVPALEKHQWKTLRMRPANFPTIRIAQLAAILSSAQSLFASFIHSEPNAIKAILSAEPSVFWSDHYSFEKSTEKVGSRAGATMIDLVMINTVAPILAAYSIHKDEQSSMDKALMLLQRVSPENNKLVNIFIQLGMRPESGFDTQAYIHWHNEYCAKRRCLQCAVGVALMRSS